MFCFSGARSWCIFEICCSIKSEISKKSVGSYLFHYEGRTVHKELVIIKTLEELQLG